MAENVVNAPAGRVGAFQGLANDLDTHRIAQRRPVAQARILDFKPFEKNTLRAFFSLELASGLILRGCTLHTKNGKFWIGLPAKPYTTDTGTQSWAAIIDFRDKQTAARFQEMATAAAVEAYGTCGARHEWATHKKLAAPGLPGRGVVDYPTAKKEDLTYDRTRREEGTIIMIAPTEKKVQSS